MKKVAPPFVFAGALIGAFLAGRHASATRVEIGALTRADGVGPRALAAEGDEATPRDGEELRQLLADPAGPERIRLTAGEYHGDFVVRRRLTLAGDGAATLVGSGKDTVLRVEADDATVENLAIRGSGGRHTLEDAGVVASGNGIRLSHLDVTDALFGISLRLCHDCVLDHCHVVGRDDNPELRGDAIKLWESDGSLVANNAVEKGRDLVVWYSRRVTLDGNIVTGSRYGSHFMYANDSVVRNSRFVNNVVGVFVMYSTRVTVEDNVLAGASGPAGVGIGFKEADDVFLRRNAIVANTAGAYIDQSPRRPGTRLELEDNLIALNRVGVRLHGSERGGRFFGNDFHENATLVEVDQSSEARGVEFSDNRYSDYEGYDLDADGVGDVAYEERVLSGELLLSHPVLRLYDGTAALGAIDAVSRALPVFSARRVLADARPRLAPIERGAPQ